MAERKSFADHLFTGLANGEEFHLSRPMFEALKKVAEDRKAHEFLALVKYQDLGEGFLKIWF